MSTTSIVILVVVVVGVAILASVAILATQRRRLRSRFGSEYERTLASAPNAKQARADLRQRAELRDQLPIHPLNQSQRLEYEEEWKQIQAAFVDAPARSLDQADALLTNVMVDQGYPMQDFEGQADLISVDHPEVVERYRSAHELQLASHAGRASTEDVRHAFVGYRELFADLLDGEGPTTTTDPRGLDVRTRHGSER